MQYSDYELVYMVRENEDALSYLLSKYEPLFRKVAFSFVKNNPRRGIDVDDVIQHCRIALCFAVDRFDENNDILFYSYLLVCLKRAISTAFRSNLRRPDYLYYMDLENYEDREEFVDSVDTFKIVSDIDFDNDIIFFKHTLDFLDSSIFELRYNNFSYKDIASLLDINVKKVDNSLLKIRKKLEKYFLF